MEKKINSILLVDDDHITNFIHQKIISNLGCAEEVQVAKNGLEAINLLLENPSGFPSLILLDINMPKMNGWEFLDAYAEIEKEDKEQTVIVILTTSQNPDDFEKAKSNPYVKVIENKPMTKELLGNLVNYYFN